MLSVPAQEVDLGATRVSQVLLATRSSCPTYTLGVVFVWSLWPLRHWERNHVGFPGLTDLLGLPLAAS